MKSTYKITGIFVAATLMIGCAKQSDPVITLNGADQMTIYIGDTWTDPGATAVDYKGRDISADIDVSGGPTSESGYTTVDYTVSDKKGNFAVVQRGVTRGFKNSDLEGTYSITRTTNNGGGTQTYTGTVTAGTGDIVSITLDNTNSYIGPVMITATITSTGSQITALDQSYSGCSITNGQYSSYLSNETGSIVIDFDFATNCGFTGIYNHETTWTKQ